MSRYVAPIFAVLVKDVMLEIRTKNIVVSVIVFALSLIHISEHTRQADIEYGVL